MNVTGQIGKFAAKRQRDAIAQRMKEGMNFGNSSKVDWEDYNYPPLLQIIHFSLDDIEDAQAKSAVRWAHMSYRFVCFTLLFNIAATLVLVSSGAKGSFLNVLYSIFNFIIVSLVGLYSFYNAYKGLATNNMSMSLKYIMIQCLTIVFMVVSVSAYGANFNGLGSLKKANNASSKIKQMWVAWVIVESIMWIINLCTGIYSALKVQQNRREGRPTAFPLTENPT
ncbi:hypothetical protein HOP50_16g78720 [Chloropicon primus]|uniref:Secretory carrier-associated membrane protein n=1 Tax=Chloropicon primus TaxID=1764295 RepID=A0A5B8N0M9_9CHLO|nr:hypothetical protein A3770_16p78420 [Chloropicon primus]UPR04530.1 hypothetical protein HOP50_16g78720 [Chloropicon primus]|eukprot:QDZ25324.1 hypothetical protein A3770_16p78420 [Chloropicon primus]